MIKTGIAGGGSPLAGELLRILMYHPDVDLLHISAPELTKRSVPSVHHGLIGEPTLYFEEDVDPSGLDALFVCPGADEARVIAENPDLYPDLRVIDMKWTDPLPKGMVAAVSEIYRKPMVRGAKRASTLHPLASIALVALYPLANHLLLPDKIHIEAHAPKDIIEGWMTQLAAQQTQHHLSEQQNSFEGEVNMDAFPTGHNRSVILDINLKCNPALDEILSVYESVYDDHSFTFMTLNPIGTEEVSGTQKCIITLEKPNPDTLHITVIADCRMRGGAGDAVHAFNLLFGLHERTGLNLKPAKY